MDRVATTFRIDPAVKDGLARLSKLKRQSLNQLANEAIREFVARRGLEVERELVATLEDLRAYRERDPDFERALARIVEAEATAREDPAEGKVVTESGAARARVRDLLNE